MSNLWDNLVSNRTLPIGTMSWYTDFFGNTVYIVPYLNQGIVLSVIGIILLVIGVILYREYRFRATEKETKLTLPPPPPPSQF